MPFARCFVPVGQQRIESERVGAAPAAPYMSDEAEAAVGLALGTLSVAVSAMYTALSGSPSAAAATCATLVCRPCERQGGHTCYGL